MLDKALYNNTTIKKETIKNEPPQHFINRI